ncbi:MAG TPA: hypothetical protein VFO84_05505, partial [Dehalococcoidia bacterium]|nr:hypothetical protein [Dehalococcoidia bacterium]
MVIAQRDFDMAAWTAEFTKTDGHEHRVIEGIGSRVLIDEDQGLVFKKYRPGKAIRALYWLSFQSKFPYESNTHALRASELRRAIADLVLEYEL